MDYLTLSCEVHAMMSQTIMWTKTQVQSIYTQPLHALLYEAHTVHRQHHNPHEIEAAILLNIKTGACPEDCGYCSQSAHYDTNLQKEKLFSLDTVLEKAKEAKAQGATRFCMGAAWRHPPDKAMPSLIEMIKAVKALGLETCMTLGMLKPEQASALKEAGLDFYNHNLDTSPEYYDKVVTTRTYADRLKTLEHVQSAGMKVCCGGILGLGETREDRISFLVQLANLSPPLESVPINGLVPVAGTPLSTKAPLDPIEMVRTIATARILMPTSVVRLSAGRTSMSDELQALCFFAGANSIFLGDKLLTTENPSLDHDTQLLHKLG